MAKRGILSSRALDRIVQKLTVVSETFSLPVRLVYRSYTDVCPNCSYNHMTESSNNPNCPTCSGNGKITYNPSVDIYAEFEPKSFIDVDLMKAGILPEGDGFFTINVKEIDSNPNLNTNDLWNGIEYIEHYSPEHANASGVITASGVNKWKPVSCEPFELAGRLLEIRLGCEMIKNG